MLRRLSKWYNNSSINSRINLNVNVYWESQCPLQRTAARIIRKKSVFCIDNINSTCSADDIRSFVTEKLSVQVYSCFEVRPRRRGRLDNPGFSRKAFRLCICADDCARLLNASMWPDSVVLIGFFKSERNTVDTVEANNRNTGTITSDNPNRCAEVDASTGNAAEDNDATILTPHNATMMNTSTTVHDG